MKAPWKRMSMKESLKHYVHLNVDELSDEHMRQILKESGHCDPKKLQVSLEVY